MADIIAVNDVDDERLSLYRNVKDRDLTGREGRFMAEGKVVLERLFASRYFVAESVLTTPERLSGLDISRLPEGIPVYIVPQALMDQIVGFPIHRGYLAIGLPWPVPLDVALGPAQRRRVLALSAIANTDNMGGLMRNAAAFGIDAVFIDTACCDPLYRKAIRVSVGGVFEVPHVRVDDLMGACESYGLTPYALSPAGAVTLDALQPAPRSAFLFGAEGPGLSPEAMKRCTTVRIPMHQGFDSLNVATTSGIVLYHACK